MLGIVLALRVVRVGYSSRGLWEHGVTSYGAVYVDKHAWSRRSAIGRRIIDLYDMILIEF